MNAALAGAVVCTALAPPLVAWALYAEAQDQKVGRWLGKTGASLCFVATGLLLASTGGLDTYAAWLLVGLVLAAVGDALLIPKGRPFFLAGLATFLVAHVAYAVGFLRGGPTETMDALWAGLVLLVPLAIAGVWLWPHVKPPLRGPVAAYMLAITVMVAAAWAAWQAWAPRIVPLGALLFYVSDLAVARDRFVAPGIVNRLWGLPAYYAGQFLLAWSLRAVAA